MIDPKAVADRWFARHVYPERIPPNLWRRTMWYAMVEAEVSLRRIYRPILGAVRDALERLGRAVAS